MTIITLPLHEFLDYLWSYKDKTIVSLELGHSIAAIDSVLTHVEFHATTATVWRKKDWLSGVEHYKKIRETQQREMEEGVLRREVMAYCVAKIQLKTRLPLADATRVAEMIVRENNLVMAKCFGIDSL